MIVVCNYQIQWFQLEMIYIFIQTENDYEGSK
jgi:hypothetical protein